MKKPSDLQGLIIVPVHAPVPGAIGKYETRHEIRNSKGNTVLSDDISLESKRYICALVNEETERDRMFGTEPILKLEIPGQVYCKQDSKKTYTDESGMVRILPSTGYRRWLKFHTFHRAEYVKYGSLKHRITDPCNVELVFQIPFDKKSEPLVKLIPSMLDLLIGMKTIRTQDLAQGLNGSKIVRVQSEEYATIVTIRKL